MKIVIFYLKIHHYYIKNIGYNTDNYLDKYQIRNFKTMMLISFNF
jgi:hypothetical protein